MGLGILPPPGVAPPGVAPPKAPDVQDFTSSGTWTMPDGAQWIWFEAIAGGRSGGSGGGGVGGAYVDRLVSAADVPATMSITVGSSNGESSVPLSPIMTTASNQTCPGGVGGTGAPTVGVGSLLGGGGGGGGRTTGGIGAGSAGGTGGTSAPSSGRLRAGNGGVGGGYSSTASATVGGAGVAPGGGGGGGGYDLSAGTFSSGGAGARGAIRITTYF